MDEHKLEELFQRAAPSAPESSFGRQDVVRGSRRITARRRVTASAGALAVAAVALGGVGVGTDWFTPGSDVPSVAGEAPTRQTRPAQPSPDAAAPGILSQPRDGDPNQAERQAAGQNCGPPDARVVATVREVLPRVAASAPVSVSDQACRPGARAAAFPADEGAGHVLVVVRPAERAAPAAGQTQRPDGARQVVRATESGRAVVVVSVPAPGSPPPYAADLPRLADGVAQRY